MGQVIGAISWVLAGDDDPQDWKVAIAHGAQFKDHAEDDLQQG